MAIVTEKNWTVEVNGMLSVEFESVKYNGVLSTVNITIDLDNFICSWGSNGKTLVYENNQLTKEWLRLEALLGSNFKPIEDSLKKYLNDNLTNDN